MSIFYYICIMSSGIYKIINTITNDFYIGSSVQLNIRKKQHFSQLINNIHNNKYLQNSFNKYGLNNFIFEIISICPSEYCLKLEQWFIDTLNPKYNQLLKAGNSLGYKHNNQSLIKLKEQNKDYCSKILYQYDEEKLIQIWNSSSEYAKYYNINRVAVYKALRKGHKCAGYTISRQPATL